jgi:hypothetical protein
VSKIVAKRIDPMLQIMIEHVADHDHSALRPLSHAAEIGMVELSLGSIALYERAEHRDRRVETHFVAPRDILQDAKGFRREVPHA